jgi:mRNA interferase MazF
MIRGEIYDVRLDPVEGSEQAGVRPAVIVSRDQLNAALQTVIVVPCSSYRPGRRIYAAQVLLRAPEGGLRNDSVVLGEQVRVLAKHRLLRRRGAVSPQALARIEQVLTIALDLPEQV